MCARAAWEITREMFLSLDEVASLLRHVRDSAQPSRAVRDRQTAAADDHRDDTARLDRLVIELLLFSGLRNSELCRLAMGDVIGPPGGPALEVRQTGRLDHLVYLPAAVYDLIEEYRRSTRLRCLPARVDPGDPSQPLVYHERRRPFERNGLYRRVVRILTAAGLESRASVQLLRHTYGYLAYLRTGGNLLFTQRQLGHAHPMVTSIYAQFVDESYAALAERAFGELTT